MSETRYAGGCQCGAVRFAVGGPLGRASICHCRMCQKATGGLVGAFVGGEDLLWTRGAPSYFQSWNKVRRGFCAACGTPLTFEWAGRREEIAIPTFDDANAIAPAIQVGVEGRLPWFGELHRLPERTASQAPWLAEVVSNQHPDHDTGSWPPA
jgi:hypothetical protein